MDGELRREKLRAALAGAEAPMSAGSLAAKLGVSRQVIVGDVALLRAGGESIFATPRGYELRRGAQGLRRVAACRHDRDDTERELLIMVDNGCSVLDVVVEHPVYGELTGELRISSRYDVSQFVRKLAGSAPLSALTGGIHLHNLLCPDEETYERTLRALDEAGFLLRD